jgi:ABC-2 type transport system permease protein
MKKYFSGTLLLTGFMMRRERIITPIWLFALIMMSVALVPGVSTVVGSGGEEEFIATITTPPMIAMMGPLYCTSDAGLYAFMMLLWTQLAVGIMNIFLIVRHTRADEERGRTEVIRSLPVGRLATLGGAMLTAVIANTVLAVFTGIGMFVTGVEGFTFGGCMLYGALLGVFGLFCAALTAIFCQLCVSSRGALALPAIIMVSSYMVRAMGDMPVPNELGLNEMPNEALSYLSPMGILQRSQVFTENETPLPVFAVLAITVVLTAVAFALNRVRDMGEGFIPAKPGRRTAGKTLLQPFGLHWRLIGNTLIWWTVGLVITAALYGSILGDIGGFIESNEFYGGLMLDVPPELAQFQEKSFVATISIVLMICAVFPVLAAVFRLRREEGEGRLENVLAGSVSRRKTLAGYVLFAFATSVLVPLATAFGFYGVAVSVMETPLEVGFFLDTMLVYIPALWVILGLATALVGWFPKATVSAWVYVVYSLLVLFFGRMAGLPDWVSKTTPFGHVPMLVMPDASVNWLTMAILTAIAAGLTVLGFVGYSRRDMQV